MRLSIFCKKGLHENLDYSNILLARGTGTKLLKALQRRKIWLVGQEAKTLPSHGRIMGSIPVRATKDLHLRCRSFIYSLIYITYLSVIIIRFCGALFWRIILIPVLIQCQKIMSKTGRNRIE